MVFFATILHVLLALALCPLLIGLINRTKAVLAGRRGQPLLQLYFDLAKLLQKGAVYSRTTTFLVKAGPMVGLAAALAALLVVPLGSVPALLAFPGDILVLAYFLGLMRFFTVLAALDTGSAFEGMGASREVQFSALAEPALLLALAAVARQAGSFSLSGMYASAGTLAAWQASPALLLAGAALAVVFLSENCRIPVDDPNTHLELTMIHEVMVLDHGGVDFAFIQYAAALKMWVLGSLLVGLLVPVRTGWVMADLAILLAGLGVLAVAVGMVESCMARLRLLRVPRLLLAAGVLAALALALVKRAA